MVSVRRPLRPHFAWCRLIIGSGAHSDVRSEKLLSRGPLSLDAQETTLANGFLIEAPSRQLTLREASAHWQSHAHLVQVPVHHMAWRVRV